VIVRKDYPVGVDEQGQTLPGTQKILPSTLSRPGMKDFYVQGVIDGLKKNHVPRTSKE
jgi:hypothetical protein